MKKIILIAVLLLVSLAPDAFAHSHLESSTPSDGEVISEELSEITLTFSGKIEQGSTFKLLDSKKQVVSVEDITIADTEISGTIPVSLINGNYVVDWNIISADGHQMEGEFSFEVKIAETESPPANNNEEEQVSNHEANQDRLSEQDSKEKENGKENDIANDQIENDKSSILVPIIIGVLIVAIIITFISLRRKK